MTLKTYIFIFLNVEINFFLFKVTSVIYLIGFIVYTLFSDSETQSWALNESRSKNVDDEKTQNELSREETKNS